MDLVIKALRSTRLQLVVACSIWLSAFAGLMVYCSRVPLAVIPYSVYASAGLHWLSREPLYETVTIDGFQYFPQSALLFSPFALLGFQDGMTAWRAVSWFVYATGLWRLAALLGGRQAQACFAFATALCVVPALGSLGNGQANLALGALMLHASAELILRHWWRAAVVLTLGFALKPLMVVLLLLAWVTYPALRWRVPVAVASAALAPFALRDTSYVISQYRQCALKLSMCATPGRLFEDVRGLLAAFGWLMPHPSYLLLRALAAIVVLVLCMYARHRVREPHATFLVAALASGYLMLFNPRTLSSSYAIPAANAALLASLFLLRRRWAEALTVFVILASWTVSYHVFGFIQYWLRPLACVAFCVIVVRELRLRAQPV